MTRPSFSRLVVRKPTTWYRPDASASAASRIEALPVPATKAVLRPILWLTARSSRRSAVKMYRGVTIKPMVSRMSTTTINQASSRPGRRISPKSSRAIRTISLMMTQAPSVPSAFMFRYRSSNRQRPDTTPPARVPTKAPPSQIHTREENPGIGSVSQRTMRMDSKEATTDNARSWRITSRLP